jgi:glycosyltransferase involved in cell wall biosynthesis
MYEDPSVHKRRFARTAVPGPKPHLEEVDEGIIPSDHARPWTHGRPLKLSILMPAYNEAQTIEGAVKAVLATEYPCDFELIVVDDGSSDATAQILERVDDARCVVHRHPRNMGKGAALHTAAAVATGTHIVPFDADLEYSPADLPRMVEPILRGRTDVVYGTRLFGVNTMYQSYRHAMGNRALTLAANLLFDAYLSDMHTCLKLVPLELFRQLELRESGFGLDTEITAKILKIGVRPFEVPVSYHSRSVEHGKKITWKDGVECLQVLTRVRMRAAARVTDRRPAGAEATDNVIDAAEVERRRELVFSGGRSATG